MAKLRITWVRSAIGQQARQKKTIKALGLKKLHHTVEYEDVPQIRGMINQVHHLVEWTVVED
ncbi:MAG: 50S ribosomal protein L30 [Aminobacterium sp.]|jgi:large subunit ribosomal protein L30|uniref:50S ribosomal protein L30 n=1 Tax=unclassified Aminobacterium TaxID=2685012 RepID=UPI001BCD3A89|nr:MULTISPECIES: 50S ribosomal protein L30 [unclassified Aminobacterium]MDD2207397.1 50S ribosomal protein L30 [Aminobacterium sp.]MDD3426977.1 50S ribosomal protein L30 [Aminobacterium sp.]MDD3707860.1 50S ribosomal protein L30 [Aminobacterium sp.]MDD4229424.1 50S ribosomal protein L30 [Aminobacterium sp.]MDD4552122.1 50S ribosomal protein L30 [Aminobacterium sp.]